MSKGTKKQAVLSGILTGLLVFSLGAGFFVYKVTNVQLQKALRQSDSLQLRLTEQQSQSDALQKELDDVKAQLQQLQQEQAARPVSPFFADTASAKVLQGELLKICLPTEAAEEPPVVSTDLGPAHFVADKDGDWAAYVPVGFAQTPGEYPISVTAGSTTYELQVTVQQKEYGSQTMNMSSATNAATRGAEGASQEYAEKVKSLYGTYEEELLWDGLFVQPVEGRITTEFGLHRYTKYSDGTSRTTRHTGIDIAAASGTPVPAANGGKVVFAGELLITGNTVVIEHGGGLKTYYFHMSELDCQTGDPVKKGDLIGKVGSTGYSTGAHLHFEVMLGEYSLNPWSLFDGSSMIYQ
ncbi:MAG: M23 family metallopeptidase [Firmicutes bacterium]|nr:M23 family metallopeptidase [Bacillota bacterium]